MVRLVFRPYTQIRRTICTSVALRTFIRVSPEFVLLKHSSPSFGSLCMCSNSNPPQLVSWLLVHVSQLSIPLRPKTYTHKLAHASDSLVRVSRRVKWNRQLKQSPCTPTRNLRGMLIGNSSRLHINALQQAFNQWPMKHARHVDNANWIAARPEDMKYARHAPRMFTAPASTCSHTIILLAC